MRGAGDRKGASDPCPAFFVGLRQWLTVSELQWRCRGLARLPGSPIPLFGACAGKKAAEYDMVGDLFSLLPALTGEVRQTRKASECSSRRSRKGIL